MQLKPVAHGSFTIEREFSHHPEKVFAAFSDPRKKRRWMGGDDAGFTVESFEPNFAVDAYERWSFRYQGGPLIRNDTCYHVIIENRRIVFGYTMDIGDQRISASLTTIDLEPTARGTKMTFTEQGVFFDGADGTKGREEGTRGLLEELAKELAHGR